MVVGGAGRKGAGGPAAARVCGARPLLHKTHPTSNTTPNQKHHPKPAQKRPTRCCASARTRSPAYRPSAASSRTTGARSAASSASWTRRSARRSRTRGKRLAAVVVVWCSGCVVGWASPWCDDFASFCARAANTHPPTTTPKNQNKTPKTNRSTTTLARSSRRCCPARRRGSCRRRAAPTSTVRLLLFFRVVRACGW